MIRNRIFLPTLLIFIQITLYLFQTKGESTPHPIKLGQTCPLSGPAQNLGIKMRDGLLLAFTEVNAQGGIQGRKIDLITKDDRYEPLLAIRNTRELLYTENVLLIIGTVGTPTTKALLPITTEEKVPLIAPLTGAGILRKSDTLVINVRANYDQETENLIAYLVEKRGIQKIACFYQKDGYGLVGLKGVQNALQRRKLELIGDASYERNTRAVKQAAWKIKQLSPEGVVMVGTAYACADFVKVCKQLGLHHTIYTALSFMDLQTFYETLGVEGEGCIISQVVPPPWERSFSIVKDYLDVIQQHQSKVTPDFISLEGYLAGRFLISVFQKVQGELTRESILKTIQNTRTFNFKEITLEFGEQDNQGLDLVLLTTIQQGKVVLLQ